MSVTHPDLSWLNGKDELSDLIRAYPWSQTSLGALADWPQSLRSLTSLILASPLATALIAGSDHTLLYNEACSRLLGNNHPSVLGHSAAGVLPLALGDSFELLERLEAGEAISLKRRPWVSEEADAPNVLYLDAYFTPVRGEAGRFSASVVTILPAGGSPAMAESVQEPVFTTAQDALFVLDTWRMRLDYAAPAFDRLLGDGRGAVASDFRHWLAMVLPGDRRRAETHIQTVRSGEAAIVEYRVLLPGGTQPVHFRQASFPIRDQDGVARRLAGLLQDVTEISRAAAIAADPEPYRLLTEGIPQLIWRASNEGIWKWASPQWLDYTGQTQEQTHGWGWLDAVHPDDREATIQAWHTARPHGELDVVYRLRRGSDGAWRWFQTRSRPHRTAEGGEEWFGTSTDIDDLKRAGERQAMLTADLERRVEQMMSVIRRLGGEGNLPHG